jgi:hypothetical protein
VYSNQNKQQQMKLQRMPLSMPPWLKKAKEQKLNNCCNQEME